MVSGALAVNDKTAVVVGNRIEVDTALQQIVRQRARHQQLRPTQLAVKNGINYARLADRALAGPVVGAADHIRGIAIQNQLIFTHNGAQGVAAIGPTQAGCVARVQGI